MVLVLDTQLVFYVGIYHLGMFKHLKTVIIFILLLLGYLVYYAYLSHWLVRAEYKSIMTDYQTKVFYSIYDSDFGNDVLDHELLRVILNSKVLLDNEVIEARLTASPLWKITELNDSLIKREHKILSSEVSVLLSDGQWLNYKVTSRGLTYESLVYIFMLFLLIVVLVGSYFWFAGTLSLNNRRMKSLASSLSMSLRSKIRGFYGLPVLDETVASMRKMQTYLLSLVEQRSYVLGVVSHDLQQPISRLNYRLLELEDSQQKRMIKEDLSDLQEMINELISYTRHDVYREERILVDALSIVWKCCDHFIDQGCQLETDVPEVDAHIMGAPKSLNRAIENILSNAFKYGKTAQLSVEIEKKFLKITVIDDGPGVPVADLKRLTQPFFRSAEKDLHEKKGSGIGLASVKDTIIYHEGELKFVNSEKGGLAVTIKLPLTNINKKQET